MPSFDVVSELDSHEVTNALDQANRELSQRFDFKDTGAVFELNGLTVFVKAQVRTSGGRQSFRYKEIVYCERPSISRFVELVESRRIVFEFLMSERENGKVRNHGYPWRLIREDWLSDLFSLRVKLR